MLLFPQHIKGESMETSEVEKYKIIPFLITYNAPSKVTIKAIYYYDPQLEIVLPLLKKAFPENVTVEYHELTDRFDYEAWITIDWSNYEHIWTDQIKEFKNRVLKVLQKYVKKQF
jgi:hypothetical protein